MKAFRNQVPESARFVLRIASEPRPALHYGDTWYLTGKRSARFKCLEASKISIPTIRLSAPISRTISSVDRRLTTSCFLSSSRMYTRSALGLYRISILFLPFSVKDVNGNGDCNISLDNEIDFHSFLFVIRSKSVLFEIINFCLTQTAEFRGYRSSGQDHVLDFVRIRTSFLGAFECMRIDLNVHLIE